MRKRKRLAWRPSDIIALRLLYPNMENGKLGRTLVRRRTWSAVQNMAVKLGLKKSPEFMRSPACRFPKGLTPWNKGKTGYMGANRTSFRKGNRPQTWLPIGTEKVDKDGTLMRKVSESSARRKRWRPVKDLLWEAKRGPIPSGAFVVHRNRNRQDFRLRNLALVDRAGNMRRNTYHRYPKEIALAIQLRGALQRQINKREGKHERQHDHRPA